MKKLLSAALLLAAVSVPPAQADQIILGGDPWCPFNCEAGAVNPGYLVEIAQRVFTEQGHTFEYKILPWTRAIEEARRGDMTGIVGAYEEDAPDFVFPSVEQGMMRDTMFVLKDNAWKYEGVASLDTATLGIIKDYAYSDEILGYLEQHKSDIQRVQEADGENALQLNIRKLLKGRISVVAEVESVFWYNAGQLDAKDKFKIAGTSGKLKPAYIAFSPANPKAKEYAQMIAEGTEALRASGELAKILAKYNLEDWK